MPIETAPLHKLIAKNIRKGFEILGVAARVIDHPLGEWPPGPICFLRTLLELHVEKTGHKMVQPELADAKQTAREHGVEDRAWHEIEALSQQAQIIVRAMHNQFAAPERLENRIEFCGG